MRILVFWGFIFSLYFLFFLALTEAGEKIDINKASLEDLIKIIHIGEKRAKEIISQRPFSSLNDLLKIKGIGKKRLKDIKKQGLAYVGSKNQAEPQTNSQPPPYSVQNSQPKPQLENQFQSLSSPKPKFQNSNLLKNHVSIYPSGIVINEILPSPQGQDKIEEWIEIFNQNNFEVDLSDWKIKDVLGKTKSYTFPQGTKIKAKGFLVLPRPKTKIILNNEKDGLKLFRPDGKISYSMNYQRAIPNQSYNLTEKGWLWSSQPTPGSKNIIISSQKKEKRKNNPLKKAWNKKRKENLINKKQLATLSQTLPKQFNPFLLFLTALGLAIISGIIVLFLKKKFKKFFY